MRYKGTFAGLAAALTLAAAAVAWAPGSASAATAAAKPCGTMATPPAYQHVIWIWMENHSYSTVIGSADAPYITSIAKQCGVAANYHNITHPSLPNYIAATSGLGYAKLAAFTSDCDPTGSCVTSARSIFGQGETWRSYEESMPSACDKTNSGNYAVRHNPAVYYTTLTGCRSDDVPYSQLSSALAHGRLPAFSFITPNLIDDMHNGTVQDGNRWLSANLPKILNSSEYRDGSTAVFITWDEGEGGIATKCATNQSDVGCHVAAIVISPSTKAGTHSTRLFNHYSLLATAEQLLGLPKLGLAGSAATMLTAFRL